MTSHPTSRRPSVSSALTPGEMLIWTGQRLEPEAPLYNMALALDIAGTIDARALQEALARVVREADALRTVVRLERGAPVRAVLDDVHIEIDIVRIPGSGEVDETVRGLLEGRTRRVFALDRPMTDVALFQFDSERSILYLNQHHLITDASSTGVLYRRLAAEYRSILGEGRRTPGSVLQNGDISQNADSVLQHADSIPQFSDYVERLVALRDSEEFQRARAYWVTAPSARDTPTRFYGTPGIGSGRTRRIRLALSAARASALNALIERKAFRALTAEHSRFLVFSTVLAAWHARVSDQTEVAIGTPSHNRTTAHDRDTLGLFIELYPLRLTLSEDETFNSLASKVAGSTLDMLRHVVPGAGTTSNARDFSVVLNYITARIGDFAGLPASADWVHSGFGDREHVLRLQVHDFDDSGIPTLDFDLDVATFGDVERGWVIDHFFVLFDSLVADPERRISAVPLAASPEETDMPVHGPAAPYAAGVLRRFSEWVSRAPAAVAVVEGEREVSYGELATLACSLAERLIAEGLGAGDVVGICLDRGVAQISAMLGVLTAGAVYMPLDPSHPDARLSRQVQDAGAALVLTTSARMSRVEAWGVQAQSYGGPASGGGPDTHEGQAAHREALSDLQPVIDRLLSTETWTDELAYVLYTSGSTGRPKGVEVTRAALDDYVGWASRVYDRGNRLTWAYFTSPAYDLSVTSIFTPLTSGGVVVCYPERHEAPGLLVRDVVTSDRVDVLKLTPSHLELLRDMDCSRSRIRILISGGEDLRAPVAMRAHESFAGRAEIYNEYGPTEATVACMIHSFDPENDSTGSVPIGVPADNARIYVLGPGGAPTVRGESGEICVAGPRVARGYRGRPELTNASFTADPFVPGGRMYRTGDMGRWLPGGVLEFLGRSDDQVKVGGVRLEIGEVAAAVMRHEGVREATALLTRGGASRRCHRCGLEAAHPEAHLDEQLLCAVCAQFESDRDRVSGYFGTTEELSELLEDARARSSGEHDCIMLYSGGKDSTYALCRIVELGANPLVFLLDNGFISDLAKDNVRRVTELLGLELVVGSTSHMPGIFAESLQRFSNVCQGCFKTVYTLALNLAVERGIGAIVTGLSRGQIFETRLADLYRARTFDPEVVDRTILDARKAYHRMDDSVASLLAIDGREIDDVLDEVTFVDFYRYSDVELDELLAYVKERTPWIRPTDTGRSTNCLINEAGIFVHHSERGFHNYALPYSWDVRLGHKERDAAVAELDDDLNPAAIRRMLDQVGYRERPSTGQEGRLIAYYTGTEVSAAELRRVVACHLPEAVVPRTFVHLDAMPLTDGGKVDRDRLPVPDQDRPAMGVPFVEAHTPVQETIAVIWADALGLAKVGIHDDFFELGGESLRCVQIAAAAREAGLEFSPRDLFANPTVARLSEVAQSLRPDAALGPAAVTPEELESLAREFGA
jgi:amino acid adenylation domain-containing protein